MALLVSEIVCNISGLGRSISIRTKGKKIARLKI